MYIECKTETGKIGVTGRFIHIRDEREIQDFYFAFCEVEVYTKEGKRKLNYRFLLF